MSLSSMARGFVWLTEAGISMAKLYWSTMVDSMIRAINRCVSGQWCQPASAVRVCQCAQQNRTATEPSFTLYVIYSYVLLKTNCLCEHLKINGLHWIFTMFVVFYCRRVILLERKEPIIQT